MVFPGRGSVIHRAVILSPGFPRNTPCIYFNGNFLTVSASRILAPPPPLYRGVRLDVVAWWSGIKIGYLRCLCSLWSSCPRLIFHVRFSSFDIGLNMQLFGEGPRSAGTKFLGEFTLETSELNALFEEGHIRCISDRIVLFEGR